MNERPFTKIGVSVYLWASSARHTIAAAEPSATPAQSKTRRSPAISGELQIVSIETSRRNWAREFRAPLRWFFQATWAIASRILSASTPYFAAYAGATIENIAAAVRVRPVPSFGGGTALRPWNPPSFVFSTPIAIAVS